MPPGRKRRTKALAGSGESAASTVVDDSTSGGEAEVAGTTVRSPPRSKARHDDGSEAGSESCGGSAIVASVEKVVARAGSPRNVVGIKGGSGSCGGSANVASAEKAVTRAGSPRNVGGVEGGSGCCGGSAIVATTEKAVARTASPRHEGEIVGGSGSCCGSANVASANRTVAQPSRTVGKETGAGRAKEAAKKREYSRGEVFVGGGAVGHVAAAKRITGELNELVFEAKSFDKGTAKGLVELASKYEALLMTVITENAHLRGQVDALKGGCGGHSSTPSRSMPAPAAPMPAPPAPVLDAITPVMPKPVETWSVVVRSKVPTTSSKEVINKVVKEITMEVDTPVTITITARATNAPRTGPSPAPRTVVATTPAPAPATTPAPVPATAPAAVLQSAPRGGTRPPPHPSRTLESLRCPICRRPHRLHQCGIFRGMRPVQRQQVAQDHRHCQNQRT
ncbi:uncharacterized protein C11orf24-like [Bactrocera neohumeralis]|uniref:uncharacterized protein C11orf24-like n=1 Tax=Bactrocera neohumeralis TaxID=98809 RepID=UPI002166AFF8|nr:uncharacterized protein C11orf24-like [Bactrocera neohumeralis]